MSKLDDPFSIVRDFESKGFYIVRSGSARGEIGYSPDVGRFKVAATNSAIGCRLFSKSLLDQMWLVCTVVI